MNALTTWLQGPRTFRSRLVRLLVIRTAAFAAVVGGALIGQVMPVATAAPFDPAPAEVPTWTAADALAHPECVPSAAWPEGKPAPAVVAHGAGDTTSRRIEFGAAWEMNHNGTDVDDVWVVGICA